MDQVKENTVDHMDQARANTSIVMDTTVQVIGMERARRRVMEATDMEAINIMERKEKARTMEATGVDLTTGVDLMDQVRVRARAMEATGVDRVDLTDQVRAKDTVDLMDQVDLLDLARDTVDQVRDTVDQVKENDTVIET